jgi:hemerythrin-like domain-containing protein
MARYEVELQEDHYRAQQGLNAMKACLGEGESVPDYVMLGESVACLTRILGRTHRAREDAMFEGMTARDPSLFVLREEMRLNHAELELLGDALREAMIEVHSAKPPPVTQVRALCRRYLRVVRDHIDIEEDVVFPLADRLLDTRAWAMVHDKLKTRSWHQTA